MKRKLRHACFIALLAAGFAFLAAGCGLKDGYGFWPEEIFKEEAMSNGYLEETEAVLKPEQAADTETGGKGESKENGAGEEPEIEGKWEEYASNYAFLTLEEDERQVYAEVLKTVLGHAEKAEVSTLDENTLERAYKAVCADYGGLFWVSGYVYTQYTKGGELTKMDFTPKYTVDNEERQRLQQQIDASVDELLGGISITDSDYDKAKYVFEILVQNVDYDASAENNQNIISAFLSRATVCQGYACATQYLLKELGLMSVIVTGSAGGESHAWNLVQLDGEYYHMDTTWGNSRYLDQSSQVGKYVNYNYLAVTSEEISRTHILDSSFALPECVSMEDNYFVREGRYFTEWNPQAVGDLLAESWDAGAEALAVKFSSPELYGQAFDYFITGQHIADYCENISSVYYLEDEELHVLTFHFSRL